MLIYQQDAIVGESIPLRFSFLAELKDFQGTGQSLDGGSIAWVSQSPLIAEFDLGSEALVTSDQGAADGIPNDATLGRFTMLAAGKATVYVSVDAINPAATYVGIVQFVIEAIPSP